MTVISDDISDAIDFYDELTLAAVNTAVLDFIKQHGGYAKAFAVLKREAYIEGFKDCAAGRTTRYAELEDLKE